MSTPEVVAISGILESRPWIREGTLRTTELPRVTDVVLEPGPDLHYSLELKRQQSQVEVNGTLSGELILPCDSCGQPLPLPLNEEFSFRLISEETTAQESGKEILLEEEDLEVDFYQNDEVDWKHLLEDQALLALPLKHLCEEYGHPTCQPAAYLAPTDEESTSNPFAALRLQKGGGGLTHWNSTKE